MKNEGKIIEPLVEYLKRPDKQSQKDRKEFYEKTAIEEENKKDRQEFRETFYFNQKNISATQEDIRNQNKVILALLEEPGYHDERLSKLEKHK